MLLSATASTPAPQSYKIHSVLMYALQNLKRRKEKREGGTEGKI